MPSLELAGMGALALIAGVFLAFWRKAGKDSVKAKAAGKAVEHARRAETVDERVRAASDDDLKRLYDDSIQ